MHSSNVCYFVQHQQGGKDFVQQQKRAYQGDPTLHLANLAILFLQKIEALSLQNQRGRVHKEIAERRH